MDHYFITDGFKIEIEKNALNITFPNLNIEHKTLLLEYLSNIIDTIAIKFNFDLDNRQIYEHQFRQNNYRDTVGLLLMLLPFIDDITGEKSKKLTSLSELYTAKTDNDNINESEPKYEYTNLQYGRCLRISKNNTVEAVEIEFSPEHLKNNYLLLLETIQTIANKLYVNWINIRPVDSESILKSKYYELTNQAINSHKIINETPFTKSNGAMSGGEMYNILSNYLFHNIKNIKWVLYDVYINKQPTKYLLNIHDILDIDNCVKNVPWNLLNETEQFTFNEKWNNVANAFIQNKPYDRFSALDITYIMRTFFFFFKKYYQIDEKYEINDDADEHENIMIEIMPQLKDLARDSLTYGNKIYEYIRDCLYQLRFTWYSKYYLNYNKEINNYELNKSQQPQNEYTAKHIYNYTKSLISYSITSTYIDQSYKQYPKLWKSVNDADKSIILSRLNSNPTVPQEWFNITGQLQRIAGLDRQHAIENNITIHKQIQNNLAFILLDVLSRNGTLSEFIPTSSLSDYADLPKPTNDRNDAIRSRLGQLLKTPYWKNRCEKSFYYLNNLEYNILDITYKDNNNIKTEKYLDLICNPKTGYGNWIYTYAMDWISQIGFFHHFLNTRIMYITGGTGVGKSTQIPKLLLYSLKMLDYKENGKIGCTQPRIPPTVNNAKTISEQMGVPIETHNKSKNENIPTNNYYIQYQYKDKLHSIAQKGLSLKIMTDGTLETQLENPVLKTMKDDIYTDQNIYDIVIVDEAHEHNKNMDLILTRMKYVAYYNNDIKLVIISATMDEDEPTYRRYYREINDNKMYPLNLSLEKQKLDRINVDRRIHISPPGESTQYNIEEHYVPNPLCDNLSLKEKQSCLDDHAVQLTLNILKTSQDGDILIFQPGEGEIKSMVESLNDITPPNVIALPYYSGLSNSKRESIEKLNKNDLTLSKSTPFDLDEKDTIQYQKVARGTYTRVIIVGTNIAEASITISTLRFVIDDGIQKANKYDYKTRSAILGKTGISESSQKQRAGRVGRVAPGTVYYMYEKGSKKNNKRQFNISTEDLSDKLFDMLKDEVNEPFFDTTNDPNKITPKESLYKYGLNTMITKQYFTKETFYKYPGNPSHYDYNNDKPPHIYHTTGFTLETVNDETGTFYIVHPDELCFNRNILGIIVGTNDDCSIKKETRNNEIIYVSDKMRTFWTILKEYLFVIEDKNTKKINKTIFGSKVSIIKQQLKLTLQQIISYIYSRQYKCTSDMIKLLAMHSTIRSLSELIYTEEKTFTDKENKEKKTSVIQLDKALNLYGNCSGDSLGLIKICNDIIQFLTKGKNDVIDNLINYKKTTTISNKLLIEKEKFMMGLSTKDYSNIDKDVLYNFLQMYHGNQLSLTNKISPNELDQLVNNNVYINEYMSQFKTKENEIKNWCITKHLNFTKVLSFFTIYMKLVNDVAKCENNINDIDTTILKNKKIDMSWFDSHTPQLLNINEIHKDDFVKISLLHGYGYNLVRNIAIINDNYYYINVFNPYIEFVSKIGKLYKPKKQINKEIPNNTLLLKKCLGSTLLYISMKDEDMNFIDTINPNIIPKVLPLMIHIEDYNITKQEAHIRDILHKLTINKDSDAVKNKIIGKYIHTIESIKNDIVNNQNPSSTDKLLVIFDDKTNLPNLKIFQTGGIPHSHTTNSYIRKLHLLLNKNQ